MNVYLDSSVVLQRLQGKQRVIADWGNWQHAYSSELLRAEVLRSIDRNRLRGALEDDDVAELVTNAHTIFDAIEFVALNAAILRRASQSFLTPLGTLDALHLAAALHLVDIARIDLVLLTHDSALAIAARSANFRVAGV